MEKLKGVIMQIEKELSQMNKDELNELKIALQKEYEDIKAKGLKLDMSRGKPETAQVELSMGMLSDEIVKNVKSSDGMDCRNYGVVDGLLEAKELFAPILGVNVDEIIIGGNASLQLMYDTVARAMILGFPESEKAWGKYEKVKFICPSPGYDRHFSICQSLGIEMLLVENNAGGPNMDEVERLVANDDTIKGIWCVPKYSNPDGITYSDEVVKRFANLKPKAKDFKIFWDNAYAIHDLNDEGDKLLNLLEEAKKVGNENMPIMFSSTSKITFAGSGLSFIASSKANIDLIRKQMSMQTIGYDKLNQLRHVKFFGGKFENVLAHMKKHAEIIRPKFEKVLDVLEMEIAPLGIGTWAKPNGGYFVSFNSLDGCAKRIVSLCKDAGVVLTPAGATFPYGMDPSDKNIRIAPTFPPVAELETALEVFVLSVKLASVEKLLG